MNAVEVKIPFGTTYMNVIRFGNGPRNFVMIAGVSLTGLEGQGENVAAAYAEMAEDFTFYLFDRRKVLPQGHTVMDMAEDIYTCLMQLEISSSVVYGVSQGGMIAQCLAIRHPELVEKLILCSSQCRATQKMKDSVEIWKIPAEAGDVVTLNRQFFDMVYSLKFLDSVRDLLPPLEKIGTQEDCARFLILIEACRIFDVYDSLTKISCPTLVIGDTNDQVIGFEGSVEIANRLGCELYTYDQYSHAVYDEAPDIKQLILRFTCQ